MRKIGAFIAFTLVASCAFAQQADPGCQAINALLGALMKSKTSVPCSSDQAATAAPPNQQVQLPQPQQTGDITRPSFYIDTPQNLTKIVSNLRSRYSTQDPFDSKGWERQMYCQKEMRAMFGRFENVMYSGYDELMEKCGQQRALLEKPFHQRELDIQAQRRVADDQQRDAKDAARKQKEIDDRATLLAEFRSGKRPIENCTQYMVTKGQNNPEELNAPVSSVGYQKPKGIGQFDGIVDQLDSETLVIASRSPASEYSVLSIGKDTRVLNPELIRLGLRVHGFATQTGTRSAKLINGRTVTIAETHAICVMGVL